MPDSNDLKWQLPDMPLPDGKNAADFPIPDRLNTLLAFLGFGGAITLLWAGSRRPEWWWALGIGVLFSYLMLFVYALIHQAQHDCLHSGIQANHRLGTLLSLLFPAPFTMIRTTHQGHHLRNRTDHEMFDLYYPTDNRILKWAQFYSILAGLFWPIIPLGGLLAALAPGVFRSALFQRNKNTDYLLGDINPAQAGLIRREMLLVAVLFAAMSLLLHLHLVNVCIMYGCFAVNWSTRQYVTHAFTQRDVVEGALNLRTSRLMSALLLNGEYDLNHHRYPTLAWNHLPVLSAPDEPRVSYARQYWRQWLGPRPCTEPAPESREEVQLSVWQAVEGGDGGALEMRNLTGSEGMVTCDRS